jgi:hypothetical protein
VSTQAQELNYGRDATILHRPLAAGSDLARRLRQQITRWFTRSHRQPAARFEWNINPTRIGSVRRETVFCVELPVSNPLRLLEAYRHAGVAPERVVFVGDALKLSDEEYYGITQMGALVHESPKKDRRQRTQEDLSAYFDDLSGFGSRVGKPELEHRYPGPYDPGPPRVNAEQLQALIDAVARKRA